MNRQARVLLVTGPPGVGKTTIIERLYEHYKKRSARIGGIITREVRKEGERIGFKIRDLSNNTEGWLATKNPGDGPRIGRYTVVSRDLEEIGAKALEASTQREDSLVLVDEIGPMEMTSSAFRRALSQLIKTDKAIVATVRQGSRYDEVDLAVRLGGAVFVEVTRENRDKLVEQIIGELSRIVPSLRSNEP